MRDPIKWTLNRMPGSDDGQLPIMSLKGILSLYLIAFLIIRLIFDRQLREAKRLLLFSDNAVNNIAWQLGFKDPAYFARFFNRLVGCSPSAYRAKKVPVT